VRDRAGNDTHTAHSMGYCGVSVNVLPLSCASKPGIGAGPSEEEATWEGKYAALLYRSNRRSNPQIAHFARRWRRRLLRDCADGLKTSRQLQFIRPTLHSSSSRADAAAVPRRRRRPTNPTKPQLLLPDGSARRRPPRGPRSWWGPRRDSGTGPQSFGPLFPGQTGHYMLPREQACRPASSWRPLVGAPVETPCRRLQWLAPTRRVCARKRKVVPVASPPIAARRGDAAARGASSCGARVCMSVRKSERGSREARRHASDVPAARLRPPLGKSNEALPGSRGSL
jgi:hypothetical protein